MYERIVFVLYMITIMLLGPVFMVLAVIQTVFELLMHGPKAIKDE